MVKKNFKDNNPALAFISTSETVGEQQAQEVQDEPSTSVSHITQGKKGQKLPRINMAFATPNLEYLQLISRIEGVSVTEYVNRLIEADKEARKDIIKEVRKLLKGVSN